MGHEAMCCTELVRADRGIALVLCEVAQLDLPEGELLMLPQYLIKYDFPSKPLSWQDVQATLF